MVVLRSRVDVFSQGIYEGMKISDNDSLGISYRFFFVIVTLLVPKQSGVCVIVKNGTGMMCWH